MNSQINRICAFDQGLGCWTGHWVNFSSNIANEAKRRGIGYVAFGHKVVNPQIVGDLDVRPTFSELPWTGLTGDREVDFEKRGRTLLEDLERVTETFTPRDLLLFPTITVEEIAGILRWGERTTRRTGARVGLLVQSIEAVNLCGPPESNWGLPFYRRAIGMLEDERTLDHFLFLASSPELAAQFAIVFGRPVLPLGMPTATAGDLGRPDPATRAKPRSPEARRPLKVGYFGHSSAAKGGHFLHDIVQATRAAFPHVEFILHVNKNPETTESLKVFDKDMPGVECLRGHITREQYYSALERCDIVLLPYDRMKYGNTPSSVLSESITAGKVVVAPRNTWLSREILRVNAAATLFQDFALDQITRALADAILRYEELAVQARLVGEEWRRKHNIGRFMDELLTAATRPSPSDGRYGWDRYPIGV